jgi:hypothetical protein
VEIQRYRGSGGGGGGGGGGGRKLVVLWREVDIRNRKQQGKHKLEAQWAEPVSLTFHSEET